MIQHFQMTNATDSDRQVSFTVRSNAAWKRIVRHCRARPAIHQLKKSLPIDARVSKVKTRFALLAAHPSDYSIPNFSCNAGKSRSGLNGTAVKRMPVAFAIALPSAAATGL